MPISGTKSNLEGIDSKKLPEYDPSTLLGAKAEQDYLTTKELRLQKINEKEILVSEIGVIIIAVLVLTSLLSKIKLIEFRNKITIENSFFIIIDLFSIIAQYSVVILSFFIFEWWIPIIIYIILVFIFSFIVNLRTVSFFLTIKPLLNLSVLICSFYCWFVYLK